MNKLNNDQQLIDQFLARHPQLAISAIEALDTREIGLLFSSIRPDQSRVILSKMAPYKVGKVLEKVSIEQSVSIIELLPVVESESILRAISQSIRNQILEGLPGELSKHIRRALSFSKAHVGAYMEPQAFTIFESSTIERVLVDLQTSKVPIRPHLFVLDSSKKLVGYVELGDVLDVNSHKTIKSLMKPVPLAVFAEMNTKDVLENWHDQFLELPVIRVGGEFLGIISRERLTGLRSDKGRMDQSAVKAVNALGDLYLIGITSLLGRFERIQKS